MIGTCPDAKRTPSKQQHQVQQYSFRTGSFFGSKLNVRSSIPRLATEVRCPTL